MTGWVPADVKRRAARTGVLPGALADHAGPSGPRCPRLVTAYEVRGIPAVPGEVALCGRPAGHGGQCYSEAAWRRKLEANARGVLAAWQRARGEAGRAA